MAFELQNVSCETLQYKAITDIINPINIDPESPAKILAGLNLKEIIIAFDKDVSQNELRSQCEKFYGIRNVSYIYDKDGLLQDKDAPIDQGDDTYEYLFNNRIHYDSNEHDEYLKYLNEQKIKRSVLSAKNQ